MARNGRIEKWKEYIFYLKAVVNIIVLCREV